MNGAIRAYERVAERLCAEVAELNHAYWSGRAPVGARAATIYRRRRRLFSARAIEALREAAETATPGSDERRRTWQLLAFALESRAVAARLPADGEVAAAEATALIRIEGRSVPLTRLRAVLAAEPDPEQRRLLGEAGDALVAERLDPALARARDLELEALSEVGIASRREAIELTEGIDFERLGREATAFLAGSGAAFDSLLGERAAAAGLDRGELDAADLPALVAIGSGGEASPAAELRAAYATAMAGLGIDVDEQTGVRLDLDPRPGKSERSFCVPIAVPGDVRIVVGCDERGRAALGALLHEAGHAQHRAHTDPELDAPARLFGDASVTESYAFLIEGLLPGGPDEFASLLLVRRYCALLLHELELEAGWGREEAGPSRARFAALLSEATGVRWSGARRLRGPDPGLYSARYLRGWMLAALWRRQLEGNFGPGWGRDPEAGARLRELWRLGQRDDAELLARREADAGELGFGALATPALGA